MEKTHWSVWSLFVGFLFFAFVFSTLLTRTSPALAWNESSCSFQILGTGMCDALELEKTAQAAPR